MNWWPHPQLEIVRDAPTAEQVGIITCCSEGEHTVRTMEHLSTGDQGTELGSRAWLGFWLLPTCLSVSVRTIPSSKELWPIVLGLVPDVRDCFSFSETILFEYILSLISYMATYYIHCDFFTLLDSVNFSVYTCMEFFSCFAFVLC